MYKIKAFLEKLLIVIFSVLVLAVIWQILSRYIFSQPSTVTEELSRFLLIWLALFGASYTFLERGHLSIDLFSEKFSQKNQYLLFLSLDLVGAFFGIILSIGGAILVFRSFELGQLTPALQIPMAIIYLAAPLNGLIILAHSFSEFTQRRA